MSGDLIRLVDGGFRRLLGTFPRGEGFWFPFTSTNQNLHD